MIKNENIQKYNFINIIITNINDCRFIFLYLLLIHFIKNYRWQNGDWAQFHDNINFFIKYFPLFIYCLFQIILRKN